MYRPCPKDGRTPAFHEERRRLEPIIDGTVLGPDNALNYGMAKVFVDEMEAKERHECEKNR